MRARVELALIGALLSLAPPARAGGPLGKNGERNLTSDYGVDLTTGPVLGSSRVIGLGGAYVAIAEGVDGNSQNPAAPAVRTAYSFDHVDYDVSFGFMLPSALASTDYFNTGSRGVGANTQAGSDLVFFDGGANLQLGPLGVGISVAYQNWALQGGGATASGDSLHAQFVTANLLVARTLADGQLVFGAGLRQTGLSVLAHAADGSQRDVFSTTGSAYQAGLLYRPNELPFRFGAAVLSEVRSNPEASKETGDNVLYPGTPDALFLPKRVILPWQLTAGAAVQLGARPLNPRFVDPQQVLGPLHRGARFRALERKRQRAARLQRARDREAAAKAIDAELDTEATLDEEHVERDERALEAELHDRYARLSRFYVLFTASAFLVGPAADSVGVESFLQRTVNRSGEHATLSWRLGVESEPWPRVLKLRLGTYFEPTRFSATPASASAPAIEPRPRQHLTGGLDLKLLGWSLFGALDDDTEWRIGGAVDAAQRYFGWSVGLGLWH